MSPERVVVTGVGVVNAAVVGNSAALGAFLSAPGSPAAGERPAPAFRLATLPLAGLIDEGAARRLSRVCQLGVAAARLALDESGLDPARGLGVVIGSEFGDLRSTIDFADGYLRRGVTGLSPLLFPNTVMNTMAATMAIAVAAKELALTLNVPSVAGELAVARATAVVAAGRVEAVLAGGVDELDDRVMASLADVAVRQGPRGEGATVLVLESYRAALGRGATILGEIRAAAWRALPTRPHGVGRRTSSRAIAAALEQAELAPADVGWVYASANGDAARDAWERALLDIALAPHRPPLTSLHALVGHHAGLGTLRAGAAAWTARSGLVPLPAGSGDVGEAAPYRLAPVASRSGLVHAVARGGNHIALVVGPPPQ